MWVWASHLFSLDLHFLACKIEKSSEASSGPFQVQYSMACSPPTRSFWRKKNSHANQKAAWSDGISDTVLLLGEIERLKAEGISCSQSVQQACEESMLRPGGENSFWLPGTLVLMAEIDFQRQWSCRKLRATKGDGTRQWVQARVSKTIQSFRNGLSKAMTSKLKQEGQGKRSYRKKRVGGIIFQTQKVLEVQMSRMPSETSRCSVRLKHKVHIAKKQCLSWIWESGQEPETGGLGFHAKELSHYPVDLKGDKKV